MFDQKAYMKEYYARNYHKWVESRMRCVKQRRAYSAKWYQENKDARKLYWKMNAHLVKAWDLARRIKDKLKIRAWHKAYVGTPKYLAWQKRYRKRAVQNSINRYCREKAAPGQHTLKQWEALKKKHGDRCAYCGKITELTRDHIIPLSKSGSNNIENLVPACKSCNSSKKDKLLSEWLRVNG